MRYDGGGDSLAACGADTMARSIPAVAVTDLGRGGRAAYHAAAADPGPQPWELAALREAAEAVAERMSAVAEVGCRWPDPVGFPTVLIGSTGWTCDPAAVVAYRPGRGPCPGCGDSRLRPGEICIVCHQTRRDPVQWPMVAPPLRRRVRTRRERRAVA